MLGSLHRPQCLARARRSEPRSAGRLRAATIGGPVATRPLLVHAGEATLSVPLTAEQALQLQVEFQKLFQTFAEKQKAQRPKRWDMMEWRHEGQEVGMEVFCNPNAHTTAFDAKLLITLWSLGGLKITTEARLSAVTSDLDAYLKS